MLLLAVEAGCGTEAEPDPEPVCECVGVVEGRSVDFRCGVGGCVDGLGLRCDAHNSLVVDASYCAAPMHDGGMVEETCEPACGSGQVCASTTCVDVSVVGVASEGELVVHDVVGLSPTSGAVIGDAYGTFSAQSRTFVPASEHDGVIWVAGDRPRLFGVHSSGTSSAKVASLTPSGLTVSGHYVGSATIGDRLELATREWSMGWVIDYDVASDTFLGSEFSGLDNRRTFFGAARAITGAQPSFFVGWTERDGDDVASFVGRTVPGTLEVDWRRSFSWSIASGITDLFVDGTSLWVAGVFVGEVTHRGNSYSSSYNAAFPVTEDAFLFRFDAQTGEPLPGEVIVGAHFDNESLRGFGRSGSRLVAGFRYERADPQGVLVVLGPEMTEERRIVVMGLDLRASYVVGDRIAFFGTAGELLELDGADASCDGCALDLAGGSVGLDGSDPKLWRVRASSRAQVEHAHYSEHGIFAAVRETEGSDVLGGARFGLVRLDPGPP